jgi:hypothetical protein
MRPSYLGLYSGLAACVLLMVSCGSHHSPPSVLSVVTNAPISQISPETGRLVHCVEKHHNWVKYLVGMCQRGVDSGDTAKLLQKLRELRLAIRKAQLGDEGADCGEPVLLYIDIINKYLMQVAKHGGVDINITRGVFVEDKDGFVQALIVIVEHSQRPKPPRR